MKPQKIYHAINLDEEIKVKNWKIPSGFYRAVFENSESELDKKNEIREILRFRVLNFCGSNCEFWVRHCYRNKDRNLLISMLINWVGFDKFNTLISNRQLFLDRLYGQEADIEVECLQKQLDMEPLRVIKRIAPPGTFVTDFTSE
jgi:hypothetical protein